MSGTFGSLDPVEDAVDSLQDSPFSYLLIVGISEDVSLIHASCPIDPEFEELLIEDIRDRFRKMREREEHE